jgi:hypothetical protein
MHNLVMAVISAVNREIYMKKVSTAVQLLDDAKADITRSRNSLGKNAKQLQAVRKQLLHIIKMVCPESIGQAFSNTEYSLMCRVDATYCQPSITFYAAGLDSFKDDRLASMIWYFATLDGSRDVSSTDYAQSLNRVYRFQFDGFNIRVDATVKSDSPMCRKVVVGSKTEVVNEYKIVCD